MKLSKAVEKLRLNPEYQQNEKDLKLIIDLGNIIIKKRLEKGLSQSELAKLIGTKQANISRIESGNANPTLKQIQKLADILDFKVNFLNLSIKPDLLSENYNKEFLKSIKFYYNEKLLEVVGKADRQEVIPAPEIFYKTIKK